MTTVENGVVGYVMAGSTWLLYDTDGDLTVICYGISSS